ncbi:MAG TPA: hypothetical protein VF109_00580, partial [Mycobacteriales bacterium]
LLLGVLLLVPLLYLALAASSVQRSVYGVTHAAREAGRAYATGSAATAADRADYAAALALADQGLPVTGVTVRYGAADRSCDTATAEPWPLTPGAIFAVCVTRRFEVPGVPGALVGRSTTVTGRYVVHADPHRDYTIAASVGAATAGAVLEGTGAVRASGAPAGVVPDGVGAVCARGAPAGVVLDGVGAVFASGATAGAVPDGAGAVCTRAATAGADPAGTSAVSAGAATARAVIDGGATAVRPAGPAVTAPAAASATELAGFAATELAGFAATSATVPGPAGGDWVGRQG